MTSINGWVAYVSQFKLSWSLVFQLLRLVTHHSGTQMTGVRETAAEILEMNGGLPQALSTRYRSAAFCVVGTLIVGSLEIGQPAAVTQL